jgi:hypothetical protein
VQSNLNAMRRSAVLFVMLFSMLWQAMALAQPTSTVNLLADLEHAAMHWQDEPHHHHDDGSYHRDDSQASKFHVFSDHLSVAIALFSASSQNSLPTASARPCCHRSASVPDPFLDGLLRPPRLRS